MLRGDILHHLCRSSLPRPLRSSHLSLVSHPLSLIPNPLRNSLISRPLSLIRHPFRSSSLPRPSRSSHLSLVSHTLSSHFLSHFRSHFRSHCSSQFSSSLPRPSRSSHFGLLRHFFRGSLVQGTPDCGILHGKKLIKIVLRFCRCCMCYVKLSVGSPESVANGYMTGLGSIQVVFTHVAFVTCFI